MVHVKRKKKNLKNTRQRSGGMWSEFVAGWTVRLVGPLNSVTKTQKPLVPDGLQAEQEPVLLRVPEVRTTPTSSAFGVAEKATYPANPDGLHLWWDGLQELFFLLFKLRPSPGLLFGAGFRVCPCVVS